MKRSIARNSLFVLVILGMTLGMMNCASNSNTSNSNLVQENIELREKLRILQIQEENLRKQMDDENEKLDVLMRENEARIAFDQVFAVILSENDGRGELIPLKDEINRLTQVNTDLTNQNRRLQTDIANLRRYINTQEDETDKLKEKIKILEGHILELQKN